MNVSAQTLPIRPLRPLLPVPVPADLPTYLLRAIMMM
jgi:hypothetical protein